MAGASKASLVKRIMTRLKKRYGSVGRRESLPMLEQLILAVLAEDTTATKANKVFHRLKKNYFDWNEVRVSAVIELQEMMAELPQAEQRAIRLKRILKQVFESTYSFDLDSWRRLTMKEVAKRLRQLPLGSQYLRARVIRDGMGGGAVPLDSGGLRVLTRLELFTSKTAPVAMAASLERTIPKGRNYEFCQLIAELAADTCIEPEPRCKHCCLLDRCPTGGRSVESKAKTKVAGRRSPRKKIGPKAKRLRRKKARR